MNRTDRLVAILLELQARGTARAEDLATHFEVSVRTMYRDLDALAEGGVPLVATPGKGYQLMDGYFLPPLAFTATEAALLALGGEFVKQRVDSELTAAADTALSKLSGVLPPERRAEVARWRSELHFVPIRRGSGDDARLPRLRSAIHEHRVVRLVYHAFRRARPEPRDVEPVTLVLLGDRWQMAGYCRLRQGVRMFRLDRIDSLRVLDERFALAERHQLRYPSADWRTSAPEARVRFEPAIERWVRERQPFTLLREEHDVDGTVFVYALVREDEMVPWLLGWGAAAHVLEPPSLRARMATEAWATFTRHAATPDIPLTRAQAQAASHDQGTHLRHRDQQ